MMKSGNRSREIIHILNILIEALNGVREGYACLMRVIKLRADDCQPCHGRVRRKLPHPHFHPGFQLFRRDGLPRFLSISSMSTCLGYLLSGIIPSMLSQSLTYLYLREGVPDKLCCHAYPSLLQDLC